MNNSFFKKKGPFIIDKLLQLSSIENKENLKKSKILNIADLVSASKNDITFFHSKKYEILALKTKASFCVTSKNLSQFLPVNCKKNNC